MKLQHGAPVISMFVLDRTNTPLPAPLEVQHERAKAPNMTGGHQLVVCSEEQIKVCLTFFIIFYNDSSIFIITDIKHCFL